MINNLQIVRAFAALNVVLFHILQISNKSSLDPVMLTAMTRWSANGIDVLFFFVISGFVMEYSQQVRPVGFRTFMVSRLIRVIPLYWFVTTVFVSLLVAAPFLFHSVSFDPLHAVLSYSFLSEAVLGYAPVLYVGWTLEWEVVFYVVFGLSLVFARRGQGYLWLIGALGTIAFMTSQLLILECLWGVLACEIYKRTGPNFLLGYVCLLGGFGMLFLLGLMPVARELTLGQAAVSGSAAFLIILGAAMAPQLSSRAFYFLADASYSIYLVQVLTVSSFYRVASPLGAWIPADLMAIACLLLTILVGGILYYGFDKPVTRKLRRKILPRFGTPGKPAFSLPPATLAPGAPLPARQ